MKPRGCSVASLQHTPYISSCPKDVDRGEHQKIRPLNLGGRRLWTGPITGMTRITRRLVLELVLDKHSGKLTKGLFAHLPPTHPATLPEPSGGVLYRERKGVAFGSCPPTGHPKIQQKRPNRRLPDAFRRQPDWHWRVKNIDWGATSVAAPPSL